nr:phosphopantothenoylcysteine decarboxylase [Geodermatophilaceae bacterium]
VGTAAELRAAMLARAGDSDAVVMAAAVADFRPVTAAVHKIKKSGTAPPPLPLATSPDVLIELVAARRGGQVIVGFAAETGDDTGDVLQHGRAKLSRKGCDLLVVNDVADGRAFGTPDNEAVLLGADGSVTSVPRGGKAALAAAVWSGVVDRLGSRAD